MTRSAYRPWGRLPWVLSHCPVSQWSFVGCLGTEQRSLATWKQLKGVSTLRKKLFLRIADRPSHHTADIQNRLAQRFSEFTSSGGSSDTIQDNDLFCPHFQIVETIDDFLEDCGGNIVIDVTCLPKRFFFPMIRRTLSSRRISNFLVTYSLPQRYPMANLAENFNDWAHLPLFSGSYSSGPAEMLVIGVGFQALGLHEHLKGEQGLPIKLLIPFPASPSSFMRSWELSRQLRHYGAPDVFDVFRADSRDPSDTFDRLVSLSNSAGRRISLAPFGPKPMSLGMCLYATLADCEVFYTQPSTYHPDYSIGVGTTDGTADVFGYCIRLDGKDFYSLV